MKRSFKLLVVVPVAIFLLMGYGSVPAKAGDTITIEKTFDSYSTDENTFSSVFPETYEKDGKLYKFTTIKSTVIDTQLELEEQLITIDQESSFSEEQAKDNIPLEEIEKEGNVYYLKSSELISKKTEPRTEYGKTTITYNGLGYIDELPSQEIVTVTDYNGKEYSKKLSRTGYRILSEKWMDDFSFPVTIYSFDADSYMLGGTEIPKGSDLSQYGNEFLSVLGLDADYYQVSSVVLQGQPYEQDGELIQPAVAHGKRRVVDVEATFEGDIAIPAETVWYYQCIYSNIAPGEEIKTIYTIQANATYETIEIPVVKDKPFWQSIIDFITNPITIAVLLILIFIVMFLILIRRKKKKNRSSVTYIKGLDK